ncbi:hypothetical protein [Streptomyces sp. NPDC059209]
MGPHARHPDVRVLAPTQVGDGRQRVLGDHPNVPVSTDKGAIM